MPAPLLGRLLGTGLMSATAARLARGAAEEALEDAEDLEEISIPVSSSAIRSIGYRGDNTITVEFIRGGTYTYDGSRELFDAFVTAPSKGGFFNSHFK